MQSLVDFEVTELWLVTWSYLEIFPSQMFVKFVFLNLSSSKEGKQKFSSEDIEGLSRARKKEFAEKRKSTHRKHSRLRLTLKRGNLERRWSVFPFFTEFLFSWTVKIFDFLGWKPFFPCFLHTKTCILLTSRKVD